jgi:hypothetical protein
MPVVVRMPLRYPIEMLDQKTGDSASVFRCPVADEITPAANLSKVLQRADNWSKVERRVDGAAKQSLTSNGGSQRGESDDRAEPRNGAGQFSRDSPRGILLQLLADTHAQFLSKNLAN